MPYVLLVILGTAIVVLSVVLTIVLVPLAPLFWITSAVGGVLIGSNILDAIDEVNDYRGGRK